MSSTPQRPSWASPAALAYLTIGALLTVWAVVGGRFTHHNASVQVFADGKGGSRLVWIADLLPNEIAVDIRAMIEQAAGVMKPTLERE